MSSLLRKVEILELNEAYQKALHWFFSFPQREITLSDLARQLSISKSTANKVVTKLVQEDFLRLKEFGRLWQISCNQSHIYNFSRKIAYNLSVIYGSSLLEDIHKMFPNFKAIILFGSYRKGDDIESSDLDIAIEVAGNSNIKLIRLGTFPQLAYRKNVVVNLHLFTRNKIDLNLFTNIANGIVLDGFLEVSP